MISLNPGNLDVVSMRILTPWRGVWMADLELEPEVLALAPTSGPVTLTVGDLPGPVATLVGAVDPRGTGPFASLYSLRVLGGRGGWDQPVSRQAFHADGGLTTATVYAATGLAVGETVSTLAPRLIKDFVRVAGAASRVLNLEPSWWVDPKTGTTFVGPRPPAIPDPSQTLIFWHAETQVAELTCDVLVAPGTPIVDPRLGATAVIVRDVEQVFDRHGSHVTAWCGKAAAGALANDLRSMVEELGGLAHLRTYLYRIVVQNAADGRLELQAVHSADGVPDLMTITPWTGTAGTKTKYAPGTTVRVAFVGGDPSQPIVDLYDATVPLEDTIDATVAVHVGPSAKLVDLAGGATPLVLAPWAISLTAAVATFATACSGSTTDPILKAAAGILLTALGAALPPPAALKVTGA